MRFTEKNIIKSVKRITDMNKSHYRKMRGVYEYGNYNVIVNQYGIAGVDYAISTATSMPNAINKLIDNEFSKKESCNISTKINYKELIKKARLDGYKNTVKNFNENNFFIAINANICINLVLFDRFASAICEKSNIIMKYNSDHIEHGIFLESDHGSAFILPRYTQNCSYKAFYALQEITT